MKPGGHTTFARTCLWILLLLHAVVWFRTAWIADDAYISFRVIDNLLGGHGLRWNVADRTQVFTHPLWLFLLAPFAALSGEFYFAPLLLSALCAAGALAAVCLATPPGGPRLVALAALLASRAYVDYSSSGLENPLTHLLLALFCAAVARVDGSPRRAGAAALAAGLLLLNRLDLAPLAAPGLAWAFWRSAGPRAALWMAAGLAPIAAWSVFSLVYYGSLLPNTAHAKVFGAPDGGLALARQGAAYLWRSARIDPATALAIAGGLACAARGPAWARCVALGAALHLAYTVRVGGDFMAGRFLTAPLLALCIAGACAPWWRGPRAAAAAATVLAAAALAAPFPSLLSGADHGHQPGWVARGDLFRGAVLDERGVYYPHTGLLKVLRHGGRPIETWGDVEPPAAEAPAIIVSERVGLVGLRAGPGCHVVDPLALGDPFLARLPALHGGARRPGHQRRCVPDGYLETIRTGENRLTDPAAAALFDDVALAARGPLWTRARWGAIARLHTGASGSGIDRLGYASGRACETAQTGKNPPPSAD